MPDTLSLLKTRLAEVADLNYAAAVLEWDQETYMPPGAAESRAQQVATLRRLGHERFTADEVGGWLDRLNPSPEEEQALVRVTQRDYARATLLPSAWVSAMAEAKGRALEAWKTAREANDFAHFAPHLQRIVDLNREKAERLRPLLADERGNTYAPTEADALYDALLDEYEPGAHTTEVAAVFADLQRHLVPLVEAIAAQPQLDDRLVHRAYDEDAQWAFGMQVAEALGYDLRHGRQDRSAHPFTTSFGIRDVRITTRLDPQFFNPAFFGTIHEVGHALYEQGIDPALDRTPLADGTSLGMHESQSRLWENLVGRSRAFWMHWFPQAQRHFPGALAGAKAEAFYRAVNRVEPSLIRVEADELTYHLHVLLRFEIERALIAETLAVADVPEAWNAKMEAYLGCTPASDADGCLQDIHWALGALGYFPTYTLGTLMSTQLFEAAERDLGDLNEAFAEGTYRPLLDWLRTHVHRWGRMRSANEILRDVMGGGLDAAPWLAYAKAKFGALYGLGLEAEGSKPQAHSF
ncbi:MAG: carboxypeptidase M32 [Rhodothermaceae bacterium]|nr:carboxypeptidase M32 [Rhodothermaceae bacterium]